MTLCEAAARPSQALLDVVERWITGWSSTERDATEAALWAMKDEARRFVGRPGWLYRGQTISDAEREAVLREETITLTMPRLVSWSKHPVIARDYAEGVRGIIIIKKDLQRVLDITRILRFLPKTVDAAGFPPDYVRYAFREGEVVCQQDGPLEVAPNECRLMDDDPGQG
jgi:hypothetical protein